MIRAALVSALAALAAVTATPAIAQPQAAQVLAEDRAVDVQRVVSPGGVEAWLVSDSTVPMIVLRANWRGGGASDPEAMTGLSSIMTDMMTEGAGSYDANAFKQRLEDLTMSLGFGADDDGVGMSLVTLTRNRDEAFALARLALTAPRFDEAPLARIRRQVEIGLRQRETNAGFLAGRALDDALIPGHPYARYATQQSVDAITRDAIVARHAQAFSRNTAVITVVGDINAGDLGRILDETFGALPERAPAAAPPLADVRTGQGQIVVPLPRPQSLIAFAAPGVQDEDPDWIPLAVANYIIGGGGFSARLMNDVREKRGLAYGISTSPSVAESMASLRGSAQSENGDVAEALSVTRAELARFAQAGATQEEVSDAIDYLTGSFPLSLDSNVDIAGVLHSYHLAGRDMDYINRRNALIRAVTLNDVNRVARLYDPARFTFVIVGQPQGLEVAGSP
ncbi:MAG: insulinase family protein [Alphaproteobacteria bacterium]|nr:insulinase family protein [Alphaproteobacteria bacterium]